MIIAKPVIKLIDIISELLAMSLLILLIVLFVDGKLHFLPTEKAAEWAKIRDVATVAILGLTALKFALKRNIILTIIFLVIIIAALVLVLLPQAGI